jgi:hypothetical protein
MPIQYKFSGTAAGLYLGLDTSTLVTTRQSQVNAVFEGFQGDQHAGLTRQSDSRTPHYPRGTQIRNDRQVSIVSEEELKKIAERMDLPEIRAEWLGANLLIKGIPNLTLLPPGTRIYFSEGAVLVVQAENLPCKHPGKVIQDAYKQEGLQELFPNVAMHLRGLVACVEKPGRIQEGETLQVEIPAQIIYQPETIIPS